jgi:hypothetical protein
VVQVALAGTEVEAAAELEGQVGGVGAAFFGAVERTELQRAVDVEAVAAAGEDGVDLVPRRPLLAEASGRAGRLVSPLPRPRM